MNLVECNSIINQMDIIDFYRFIHTIDEYSFFLSLHEHSPRQITFWVMKNTIIYLKNGSHTKYAFRLQWI
jgi:hypothetical protein